MGDTNERAPKRPYVGVLFECCGVYQRIYLKANASEYRGRCPRCAKSVTLAIGEGGTSARLFRAR